MFRISYLQSTTFYGLEQDENFLRNGFTIKENFVSAKRIASKSKIQPMVILRVSTSCKKIKEKTTPKTDSKERKIAAMDGGVYF